MRSPNAASMTGNRPPSKGFGESVPVGSAASLLIHGGLLFMALYAWQVAPRIMPEDVIAVDMVADTQSTIGKGETPETVTQGVETPAPLPQQSQLDPAPPQDEPLPPTSAPQAPAPQAPAPQAQEAPAPAPLPKPVTPPPSTPTPPVSKAPAAAAPPVAKAQVRPAPSPAPLPKPVAKLAPAPAPQRPATKTAQAQTAPAARAGPRQAAPAAPPEFDLAAASTAATGADSGGRRTPQLAARGQAGRLGAAGGGTQLTGDLEAALRRQIQPCWLEPADLSNPRRLVVVVSIDLGLDGRLMRDPVLVTPSSRAGADAGLVVAIDNALRAVRQCAPFNLPPDRYETWRQVRFTFDPRRMAATP